MRKVNDCGTFVAADLNYRSKVEPNKTRAREINQTEVIMVDGHYVMLPATSVRSMELAIQKAKACGVGYVGVKHSSHFGAAGYYGVMAAQKGLIGLSMCNLDPVMVVPGSRGRAIGKNPLAYAVPAENGRPVFLDIALPMPPAGSPAPR